jgi:hypothetical protein
MARSPQFRIPAVADLFAQLRYAPPETRLRQMENAEQLAAEVGPAQTYPRDYVVFRITGYREGGAGDPINLAGEALIGDLAAFVQRISRSVSVPSSHGGRIAIPLADLPDRLNVSERTLKRYRRQGLICHYVDFNAEKKRLACFSDSLERFLKLHGQQVARAASFTRVDETVEQRMIDEARSLRRDARLTLNGAAQVLAAQYDRARETVRGILRRHDRDSERPIFSDRGPLSPHERAIIGRASRCGVSPERLKDRFGRTATTIQRAVNEDRAIFLRSLHLSFVTLPTFEMDDAERIILSHRSVTTTLNELLPVTFALPFIKAAKAGLAHSTGDEDAMIGAYNFLKRQSAAKLKRSGLSPTAGMLDEIETHLRWATLLKRRLVCFAFRTAVIAIERNLHRPLDVQPTETIASMLRLATEVVSRSIETIDPSQGQSLEKVCAFSMDRALAALSPAAPGETRAAARHEADSILLGDLLGSLTPWQTRLSLRPDHAARLSVLNGAAIAGTKSSDVSLRELVELRYGLTGGQPLSLTELARRFNSTPTHVARRLRRASMLLRQRA